MTKRYTAAELDMMPTLCVGQTDNLKIEEPGYRVWLSRCTIADGEPCNNKVTTECLVEGHWTITDIYPG